MARKNRIDPVTNEFSTFALEEAEDNKILRASLWVAAGFHVLLLLINFPAFEGKVQAAPEEDDIYIVVPTPKWKPPEVPKTTIRPERTRLVPVPDEMPDDPEPIRIEAPRADIDLPEVDPDYFVIPEAPPAPEPEGPIDVGGDVTKPVKVHAPPPHYTEIARKARLEGYVIVQAIIDKRGDVTNVKVIRGLSLGLSEEAVKAIKQWKFEPATLGGKPVDVYYTLTVNFQLQ